jgi:hypothetical protein
MEKMMLSRCLVTIFAGTLILSGGFAIAARAAEANASLPSPPGPTVSKISKMARGSWLDLGAPKADPKWGRGRGRAWTSKMAYSKSLGGAFLFGEGVHGWVNKANGRYMDGLWLYDVNGHRWVALHPGTDTRSPPDLVVTKDGFEGIAPDRPIPIATMVHGYEMTAWDPERQLFFSMPNTSGYYRRVLPGAAQFRTENALRLNRTTASPWMFDPWNRRWHRLKTGTPSPRSGYGNVLMYIPSKQRLFFYRPRQIYFYDPQENIWTGTSPRGPLPPFGIDPTACHDPKRDRVYLGGGEYPVAKGPNAFWIYDVRENRWVDPRPEGAPGGNHFGANIAVMTCDIEKDRVYLFRHRGAGRGLYVYDARRNAWRDDVIPLPRSWRKSTMANGFYHPGLGVHFIHVANDSRDNGRIVVYRPAD